MAIIITLINIVATIVVTTFIAGIVLNIILSPIHLWMGLRDGIDSRRRFNKRKRKHADDMPRLFDGIWL